MNNDPNQPQYQFGGSQQYTPTAGALTVQPTNTSPTVPTPQPQHQSDGGNWFTHLLPTIGGIGGSILGGLATAGLGGEVVGGAGGSALGQGIENMLEGKNAIQGNDLSAAIGGGLGTGIGSGVGRLLGIAGKAATGAAGNLTAKAGVKEAENAALAGQKMNQAQFGGVNPHVQTGNNLADNQELLKSWGVDHTSPLAMQNASKGGLFMNDIDQAALKTGSPIPTTHLISSKDITKMTPEESDALAESGILGPHDTKLPTTVTPVQANKFAQSLNSNMRSIQGTMKNAEASGDYTNAKAAKADLQALTQKYNNVQKLASNPKVDATIAARVITPEEKAQLVEKYGQAQADHIENAVNSAQSHTDLVKAKLPFAQMNTLSKQALGDQQATATARETARVRNGMTTDVSGDTNPSLAQAGMSVAANAHKPVTAVLNLAAHSVNNPKVLGTLGRIGGLADKLGTVGGKVENGVRTGGRDIPGLADMAGTAVGLSPTLGSGPVPLGSNGTIGGTMQNQPQGGANDPTSMSSILAHYMDVGELNPYLMGSTTPLIQALAPQVQKQHMAADTLNGLNGSYANAGGAQGEGGILSQISSLVPGTAANTFERQKQAAAAQLGAALGISPQQALGILPQLMQNQQSAGLSQGVMSQLSGQLQ